MTNKERLDLIAVNSIPEPFCTFLSEINNTICKMRAAAKEIGVAREFTPDGRFLGDIGEVIAKMSFGLDLHSAQREGEDAVCQVSGKCIELKLRSKSTLVWVRKRPDFLITLYLCPVRLQWGVVCNGPGDLLLENAKWNDRHQRFETDLFKLMSAQKSLPGGAPSVLSISNPLDSSPTPT